MPLQRYQTILGGLFLGGWLLGHGAVAQRSYTLAGTVRDSATQQPLARASVVVDYERATTSALTDERGHFTVSVAPGRRIVVVRYVGYVPVRYVLSVHADRTLDVRLPSVTSQLEEVVVTSKGYDHTVRQPLLGVNQLNIRTLERLPAALGEVDLLRGLQLLPGVTSVGEAANGVNIRGGTTDQTLMLLDDTPIFNPTHMFGLFSVFPPDAVSGLDLYKGNVPARYGGRAAAVLDVALRNPNLEGLRLTGGLSPVASHLTADLPLVRGKLGLLVSGRGSFSGLLLPRLSGELAGTRATFGDGVAKLFWRMSGRSTLTATVYANQDYFRTPLLGGLANINSVASAYAFRTTNAMARWFWAVTPRLNLQTTAHSAHYVPQIISTEAVTGNAVTLRQAIRQRQLKSSLGYQTERAKLEVGLSATHYRINGGELLPGASTVVNAQRTPLEQGLEAALWGDYERAVSERLAVSAGLRWAQFWALGPAVVRRYRANPETGVADPSDVVDSTRYGPGEASARYGGPEPRIGLRYSVTPRASVKVGYTLMRQYVQVVTNTTTPLPTARWTTASRHIPPQTSQLWTAGWFQALPGDVYEWSGELYYRHTQHALDYRPGANFLLQPYPETGLLAGQSRAYGLELMLSKKRGELTGWVNYTYARTLNRVDQGPEFRDRINGGAWYPANFDRPHALNLSVNINQTRHHAFTFTFVYSTGRPYTAPQGFVFYQGRVYPYFNERNNARLPDYHRLDFAWTITNPSLKARRGQGRWVFTVYNLYGRRNAYSIFYRADAPGSGAKRLAIFAVPIPSLTYRFTVN